MAASSSSVQAPNVLKPIDYSLGPGSVLFPVYQDPMIQAHIDQLHEAVGSIPNMRFVSTGNSGGGGGHGDGGPPITMRGGSGGVLLSQPQQEGQAHPIHLTMMMMIAVATEDHREEEGREIAEIMTVVDQGYHGKKLRESTYLHGRRSRSWTAKRWHSP